MTNTLRYGNCFLGLIVLINRFGLGRIIIVPTMMGFHFMLKVDNDLWHFESKDCDGPIWKLLWYKGRFETTEYRHYVRWRRTQG